MKRLVTFLRRHSLNIISTIALVVALGGMTTNTFLTAYQPECPKELLK